MPAPDVILPRAELFKSLTVPDAKLIRNRPVLYEPLADVTKIIGMAPVKDHHRSGASMAMKNWYGLLGGRRNIFHQDINTIIMELAMMVKPSLVILDGTMSMMTNGPTGGSSVGPQADKYDDCEYRPGSCGCVWSDLTG